MHHRFGNDGSAWDIRIITKLGRNTLSFFSFGIHVYSHITQSSEIYRYLKVNGEGWIQSYVGRKRRRKFAEIC